MPDMPPAGFDSDTTLPIAFRGYAREPVDNLLAEIEASYRPLVAERDKLRVDLAQATERVADLTIELERRGQEPTTADTSADLEQLEESNRALSAERDQVRTDLARATERLAEVEAELEHHVGRERAVADALIEVTREVTEMRERAEKEAEELTATAEREAEEIRRAAEQDAATTLSDAQASKAQAETEAGELRARAEVEANELLSDARARADRLVEDMQQNLEERQHQAQNLLDDASARLGSLMRDLFEQIDGGASREQATVEPEHSEP